MNKFMFEANEMAKKNIRLNHGGPFGAIIVKDNEIIANGYNTVLLDNDPTAHAEVQAIRNACKKIGTHDLSEYTLYTSCFPCPMCLSAIIWANMKNVFYGNTKEDAAAIGFRDDFIYEYINNLMLEKNSDTLKIEQLDRNLTIEAFNMYNKLGGILY